MSNIIIIDDDAALRLLAENLNILGHSVTVFNSITSALDNISKISASDLVILDIYMELPESAIKKISSGVRKAGMLVHKSIREKTKTIPIIVYSACQDKDTIDLVIKDPHSTFLGKQDAPSIKDLVTVIYSKLGIEASPRSKVFIVHGHNNTLKIELKNYLQNTLGFSEPIILHEQPNMGRTLMQKFEDYASLSDMAFVLLTPDDILASTDENNDSKRQARQNVILEMGFFLGTLGRESGRVILLYSGPLDLPNDLNGVVYINISGGIEAAGEAIRREVRNVIGN